MKLISGRGRSSHMVQDSCCRCRRRSAPLISLHLGLRRLSVRLSTATPANKTIPFPFTTADGTVLARGIAFTIADHEPSFTTATPTLMVSEASASAANRHVYVSILPPPRRRK